MLKPRSGRSTGRIRAACEMTARFCRVWEETWPIASPVTMPSRRVLRATISAARTICRLSTICQFWAFAFSRSSAATGWKSISKRRGREP